MKELVLEVWADLQERRLWPVAAVLLLALVAVPVVLIKPAEETPSPAAAPTVAVGDPLAKQAVVKAFDSKPLVKISNLDQFAAKDPFKPIEQLKPIQGADTLLAASGGGAAPTSLPGGGLGGDTTGGGGLGADGPSTPPDTGGGNGGGGGGTTKPPKAKKYTYVVDLSFGAGNDIQRYQSFERLGMLPSQNSPLLVYLGVDATGTQAAFLVDSTLTADGEGVCKPSPENCGVVYLEPGEKQTFNDGEGNSYELVIDQVRKAVVRSASSRAKAEAKAKAKDEADNGATAGGAGNTKEASQQPRRFMFPVLIDLETGGHS